MGYRSKLPASQAAYVDDIVRQIPNEHGEQDAFVRILDHLAEGPKFQYYVIDSIENEVFGTNDSDVAKEYLVEDSFVIDVTRNMLMQAGDDEAVIDAVS